ncbi:hypothetical protein OEB99_16660 [Actinotalea sp. M2MS4P-6]|uniref:hypothetical protein n=1 Tax=Actinotalea sp. M2MS4P-6 TaxID=2983762 RepID=UPI0021E50635|nr:hypothetical protein [Actinotalea sp. M2MS4P-6]MCV2395949.1 hypothetical protein [Actinotalea sp. M2MS4P-6]
MSARQSWDVVRTCPECGWTSKRTTAGLANHALAMHSCNKHRASEAARARGLARSAAVDRTPKPCHHKRTQHQHGTHACYVLDRCRCIPCATANSDYETQRTRNIAYGRTAMVDAEPVRERLRALLEAGMGLKRITAVHGISSGTLTKILYGITRADGTHRPPASKVQRRTAERVLAIPMPSIDQLAGGQIVDSTGTARRVQALVALGWSVQQLAERAGVNRQAIDSALAGTPVLARNARGIRDLYDTLGNSRPNPTTMPAKIAVSRALNRARTEQWAPPAAWDDEQLDDPNTPPPAGYGRPGECNVAGCAEPHGRGMKACWTHYEANRHCTTPTERRHPVDLDEWAHLVRGGVNPATAAVRCGVGAKKPVGTIETLALRAEREDILSLIRETRAAA